MLFQISKNVGHWPWQHYLEANRLSCAMAGLFTTGKKFPSEPPRISEIAKRDETSPYWVWPMVQWPLNTMQGLMQSGCNCLLCKMNPGSATWFQNPMFTCSTSDWGCQSSLHCIAQISLSFFRVPSRSTFVTTAIIPSTHSKKICWKQWLPCSSAPYKNGNTTWSTRWRLTALVLEPRMLKWRWRSSVWSTIHPIDTSQKPLRANLIAKLCV